MKTECMDCENENLQKYADLQIKYDKLAHYCKLLEMAHDTAQLLNKTLREDNEQLRCRLNNAIELK